MWQTLLPMIERALRHGCGDSTTADRVLADLKAGQKIMWVIHEGPEIVAGLVLSIDIYPAKKSLVIEFAAGRDFDLWIGNIEKLLIDFRDIVGADTIEASCRFGLERKLVKRGWKRKAVIMELK